MLLLPETFSKKNIEYRRIVCPFGYLHSIMQKYQFDGSFEFILIIVSNLLPNYKKEQEKIKTGNKYRKKGYALL